MKKKRGFNKYLIICTALLSIIFAGIIYWVDILPSDYFIVLIGFLLICNIVVDVLLSKEGIRKILGGLFSLLLIVILIFGINYELGTMKFLEDLGIIDYKTEHYNVLVLKNSDYENITDLKDTSIGHLDDKALKGLNKFVLSLKKEIDFSSEVLDDVNKLQEELLEGNLNGIILEDAQLDIIKEENGNFFNKIKIIYDLTIKIPNINIKHNKNIVNDSFNVYISGTDSYGNISKVSRSDVNIVVSVNPKTKKVLLTNIPRDYYVKLHSFNEYDKLTHAGIYGIDESIYTVEDLLETKINYYVKVNFSFLEELVDALGGLEIESSYDFTSQDGYRYVKGKNKVNGKEALSFVRERKAFKDGDRQRGKNQEIVLESLINKVLSPDIITNYTKVLKALNGKFVTNFTDEEISKFIKKQLKDNSTWDITNISLDGSDSYDYTYSYMKNKLYVMKQNEESVKEVQKQISNILD